MQMMNFKRQLLLEIFFLLLLFTLSSIGYHALTLRQPYAYDPLTYLYAARLLGSGQGLAFCDAHNLRFGPYFTFFVFDHLNQQNCFEYGTSTGTSALLALVGYAGGEESVHWVSPVMGGMAVIGMWVLARQLCGRIEAWLSSLFLAVLPLTISVATMPMSDIPALCFGLWAMALWLLADDMPQESKWRSGLALISGLLLGITVWMRYAAFVFVLVMGVYMVLIRARRLLNFDSVVFWGATSSVLVAIVFANQLRFGSFISSSHSLSLFDDQSQMSLTHIAITPEGWSALAVTVFALIAMHPFGLLLMPLGWRQTFPRSRALLVAIMGCGIFLTSIVRDPAWGVNLRYHLPTLIAFLILTSQGIASLNHSVPDSWKRWRFLIMVGVVLGLVLWSNPLVEVVRTRLRNQNEEEWVRQVVQVANATDTHAVFIAGDAAGALVMYGRRSALELGLINGDANRVELMKEILLDGVPIYWIDNLSQPRRTIEPFILQNFQIEKIQDQPLLYQIKLLPTSQLLKDVGWGE